MKDGMTRTVRAYHVKANPDSRYGGRTIMVSERYGALYIGVGTVPAHAANSAVSRIERGELPADVIRDIRERDALKLIR